VVVIEDERRRVIRVTGSAAARVSRAEIAVWKVPGKLGSLRREGLADPRAILPVSGDDDPLFT
jgi:hypothetical protein